MDIEVGEADGHTKDTSSATDGDLVEARATTGETSARALAWLIQERRRQSEEAARNATAAKVADEQVHAARIQRQAALISAKVARINIDLTDL